MTTLASPASRPFPWLSAMVVLGATVVAAVLGAAVSGGSADPWYAALTKPRLNPPDIAFAIVWPVLFTLMVIGAGLVLRAAGSFRAASPALGLYFTQLGIGALWSLFFFGYHEPGVALGTLVALWLLIVMMIRAFAGHSKPAALLQLPYLAWITFAGYLNAFILINN